MYKVFTICSSYVVHGLKQMGVPVSISRFYTDLKNNYDAKAAKLVSNFEKEKPDIFFFAKDPQLSNSLLQRMHAVSPKTQFVMWYGDQRGCIPALIKERIPFVKMLLINNRDPDQYRMYNKAGIKYVGTLYDCFNPDDFVPVDQPRKYDVLFGGNRFKAHKFPLAAARLQLVMNIRGICNMAVLGNGWPFPTHKVVRLGLYNQAMQNAKMTLGINHFDVRKYYEERIWHCMASGRMHLTQYIRGMEDDFVNKKHLVWFRTIDEAKELVRYYLKHPDEREAIGTAGRELLLSRDTFTHRAKYLDEIFRNLMRLEV